MRRYLPPLLLLACVEDSGLDGPAWLPNDAPDGPCYEVNLGDGIDGAAEVAQLFDCVNQYGAFAEVSDLVHYVLASDRVTALLDAMNASLDAFDVPAAVETVASLLLDPDRPAHGALDIYVEVYDDDLLPLLLATGQHAAAEVDACEQGLDPRICSLPRLTRTLLAGPLLDDVTVVVDALGDLPPRDPPAPPFAETLSELLLAMQAANHPSRGNVLLGLGRLLLDDDQEGGAPIRQLVDLVDTLPTDDRFLDALVAEIARLQRDGVLAALPADLEALTTLTVDGVPAAPGEPTILDALLGLLGTGDTSLLDAPITLPGEDDPTTVLALAIDVLDDLYMQQASLEEIVDTIADLGDLICDAEADNAVCALITDLLPPVTAAFEHTERLPDALLPLVHVIVTWGDLDVLLDFLPRFLAWDLLNAADPLLRHLGQGDGADGILALVDVFIDVRVGRLTPAGDAALRAVGALLDPLDVEGVTVAPLDVLLPFGQAMLSPSNPAVDLDRLTVELAVRLVDPASALSPDALGQLVDDLRPALDARGIDLMAVVRDLLDETELWRAALHLFADDGLIARLTPDAAGGDAPWWLRDLIARDVIGRLLDFLAGLLEQLVDVGLVDVRVDTDTP